MSTTTPTVNKAVKLRVKAVGPDNGLGEMQFTGYAAIFDNQDAYGDIIRKGAFTDTLAAWEASEELLPVYWGHDLSDPDANIGHVLDAKEDDRGLFVKVQLDAESTKAATTYRLLKGRRVGDMSFSYAVTDGSLVSSKSDGDEDEFADEFYEIRACNLYEVSVVPVGANPEAEILDVKAGLARLAAKEGKVLSAKNVEALRSARDMISTVIKAAEGPSDSDAGKASASGPVKVEEPARAKAEEPDQNSPVTRIADSSPLLSPDAALSALALLDIERV